VIGLSKEQNSGNSDSPRIAGKSHEDEIETIVFLSEDVYINFLQHVFNQHHGQGIDFTNVPLDLSLRAERWLLNELPESVRRSIRPVTPEDLLAQPNHFDSDAETEDWFDHLDQALEKVKKRWVGRL